MILNIQYIGEHLLFGTIGKLFIFIALLLAFASFILYFLAENKENKTIQKIGRITYLSHISSILLAALILFYMLFHGYYEYKYVWENTASYLSIKYIISSFWAGQEGSFMLWIILQGLIGVVLLFTAKKFESRVMSVISASQFLLITMILGINFLGIKLGQSPFTLLRESMIGSDFFKNPNYLSQILDGNGINPLLENYWMVIHPPILFLGYSAAIVPFSFAIASLWKKDYISWLKPVFSWLIFSIFSLGIGIFLGGAWAYESLTFGGFWAWDPVENSSLIPWLIMLAAMHIIIVNKKQNTLFRISYLLIIFSYFLVIYASYLTRSGILGQTSVHAFGNNGLSPQMIAFMLIIIGVSFFIFFKNFKNFPINKKENFLSREFWMFLGAITLSLSAAQILISTSIPVINKLLGTNIAPPIDVVAFYNQWQIPFAAIILIVISFSLILNFGDNNRKEVIIKIIQIFIITVIIFGLEVFVFRIKGFVNLTLLFSLNFTIISAINKIFKSKVTLSNVGGTLSHIGIAIFIMGALVAFSTSKVISTDSSKINSEENIKNKESQILIKNSQKKFGKYIVEYTNYRQEKNHLFYTLDFYNKNDDLKKEFSVEPSINLNKRMGNVYNPSIYHSFKKDVFTHITYANIEGDINNDKFKNIFENQLSIGDSIKVEDNYIILDNIKIANAKPQIDINNISIIAKLKIKTKNKLTIPFQVEYNIENGEVIKKDFLLKDPSLRFRFANISSKTKGMILGIDKKEPDFIVVKTKIFPYLSILWIGFFIMILGLGISLSKRFLNKNN